MIDDPARDRRSARKAARRSLRHGDVVRYRVDLKTRVVDGMPWLQFDGARPFERSEAARRAIAAELDLRPDQVVVETDDLD